MWVVMCGTEHRREDKTRVVRWWWWWRRERQTGQDRKGKYDSTRTRSFEEVE